MLKILEVFLSYSEVTMSLLAYFVSVKSCRERFRVAPANV